MLETLFGAYYGLDWASMALGFRGAWIVGNRDPRCEKDACVFRHHWLSFLSNTARRT